MSQPLTFKRERPHDLSHSKWWGRQAEVLLWMDRNLSSGSLGV
jgi:hypothetical protein